MNTDYRIESSIKHKNIVFAFIAFMMVLQSFMLIALLFSPKAHAAPGITVGSNANGPAERYIPITGVSISGDSEDPVPVTLRAPSGELSLRTTTGLTFTNNISKGSTISFTGDISAINTALATLQYRNISEGNFTLEISLMPPGIVYYPGNGHMYEIVNVDDGINAIDARAAATSRTLNGSTGYLATITDEDENDYISARLTGDGWIGASDDEDEGDWKWISGPEAGLSFWSGLGITQGGQPVDGMYSNWEVVNSSSEPNNAGNEDCAQFYSNGRGWNDLHCTSSTLESYVVEYGDVGDLPTAPVSDSIQITVGEVEPGEETEISSCLDLIQVSQDSGDYRYDDLKLTQNINCEGETIAPLFSDRIYVGDDESGEGEDYIAMDFRGTFDGQGHTINNINIASEYNEDNDYQSTPTGLFGRTNGATIQNVNVTGVITNEGWCTGGLVGMARNTTITDATLNVDVTGSNGSVGGIVGCYNADSGLSSSVDNTTQNGDVRDDASGSNVGGILGETDITQGASVVLTDNTYSGSIAGTYSIGGILGYVDMYDTDSSLTVTNNTAGSVEANAQYVGGIIGYLYGGGDIQVAIADNEVNGDVTGEDTVGGLAGRLSVYDARAATVNNNASVDVTATDGGSTGGLIGQASGFIIEDSHTTGNVVATDNSAGGLIGESSETIIERSSATGDVSSPNDDRIGGLVGRFNYGNVIRESYATGNVSGYNLVGGLTGMVGEDNTIENSYARGSVSGDNNVGGLTGQCEGEEGLINKSYSTGQVTIDSAGGGLLGNKFEGDCEVQDSFWDMVTSGLDDSDGGTGYSTVAMKKHTTYTDLNTDGLDEAWDFENVWGITKNINDGYPCLRWTSDACVVNTSQEDEDGISNEIEAAGPNNGDANNDGIPDNQQANVASYLNPMTNTYSVLAAPEDCTVTSVNTKAENDNAVRDSGFNYPVGMMNFSLDCGTPGYVAVVKVYQYGLEKTGLSLRKHNPNTGAYFNVTSPTITQSTIGGKLVTAAEYQIADGGLLDTDGAENGVIVDPVGFAQNTVGAPNTGLLRQR